MKRRLLPLLALAPLLLAASWLATSDAALDWRLQRQSAARLEAAAREKSWHPLILYHLGVARSRQGDRKGAAVAFARAAGADPSQARAHRELGRELTALGQLSEAEAALKRALAVAPDDSASRMALGDLYRRAGALPDAIGVYEAVSRREPRSTGVMARLAECYGERYQPDRRLAMLERLVRLRPDMPLYQARLGGAYFSFGRREEAKRHFRLALERAPEDAEILYQWGRALVEHGDDADLPEAARALERAAALRPEHANTRLVLGHLHQRRSAWEPARLALEEATRLGNFEDRALLLLGQTYLRLGRAADGERMLAAYRRATDISRGIVQLEARLHNAPGDRAARLRLARIYEADGQKERAAYHRALAR